MVTECNVRQEMEYRHRLRTTDGHRAGGLFVVLVLAALVSGTCLSQTYYVDAVHGSDARSGTRPALAWKTLRKVNASFFRPGTTIRLRSGQKWHEQLVPPSSGSAVKRILFTSYGTGASPIISRGDAPYASTSKGNGAIVSRNYLIFDGLAFDSCRGDGILFNVGAFGDTVRNCDFTYCGAGVDIDGRSCQVTRCTMTDLWYAVSADSSYSGGSVGVAIRGSRNEVSWNTITNFFDVAPLKAGAGGPLYDGCFVELSTWTNVQNCDSNFIHHNRGVNGASFLETGGNPATGYGIHWNTYAYNSFTGTARNRHDPAIYLHNDSDERCCGAPVQNLRLLNNTLFWQSPGATSGDGLMGWYSDGAWDSATLICENNIFVTDNCAIKIPARSSNFSGSHNLYFRLDASGVTNVPAGTGSVVDPQFVNLAAGDFHIRGTSPAIHAGVARAGYTIVDLDGNAVTGDPSIGAYE